MIIRGGENIFPAEVEEFLHTHPQISDVHVFGIPDPKLGEVVVAWVRPHEGQRITEEELQAFCRDQIASSRSPSTSGSSRRSP